MDRIIHHQNLLLQFVACTTPFATRILLLFKVSSHTVPSRLLILIVAFVGGSLIPPNHLFDGLTASGSTSYFMAIYANINLISTAMKNLPGHACLPCPNGKKTPLVVNALVFPPPPPKPSPNPSPSSVSLARENRNASYRSGSA